MAVDVTKLIQKAHQAIERRNYDLAIFSYIQALSLQPENIDARQKLRATQNRAFSESGVNPTTALLKAAFPIAKAFILSLLGKDEEAVIACEQALKINPTFVPILKLLADLAAKLEWHEVACWQWGEILSKFDDENIDIMYNMIDSLQEIGRSNEAIALCDKIKQLDPSADIGQLIQGLAASQTAAIYTKGAEEGAHAIVKDEKERQEREADSQVARDDATRDRQIESLMSRFNLREDYKLLLRVSDIYANYDDFETGYAKSKETLLKAQSIMPTDNNIKAKMGDLEIRRLKNVVREAKALFDNDATKDASLRKAYADSVKALRSYQISEFEDRVHKQPLVSEYHHTLGKLYLESKFFEKGVAEFQQSCKDPKYSLEAYTGMGQCFMNMDNADLAIEMFSRAMKDQELFSKIKDTVYFLASAYEKANRLDEALEQFNRIFEEDIMYRDIRERVSTLRQKIKMNASST